MLVQLLPVIIAIPCLVVLLGDGAFSVSLLVTASIALVGAVSSFVWGQRGAVAGVVAIGGGYLTDWPLNMRLIAAVYWALVLITLSFERPHQPKSWFSKLRKDLTSAGASAAARIRIFAVYPWFISCALFNRFSINTCGLTQIEKPECNFTFVELLILAIPALLLCVELIRFEKDE